MAEELPRDLIQEATDAYIANVKAEHPDVEILVPVDCRDCTQGWRYAVHDPNNEKPHSCPGITHRMMGEKVIKQCNFTHPDRT